MGIWPLVCLPLSVLENITLALMLHKNPLLVLMTQAGNNFRPIYPVSVSLNH